MPEHDKLLDEGPRMAPEPLTAEERSRQRKRRAVFTTSGITTVLGLVVLHAVGYIPTVGGLVLIVVFCVSFGFSIYRFVTRKDSTARRTTSPVRGFVLLFLVLTLAALVLDWVGGYQPGDWIVVAVPAGILVVLWLVDRGLVRLRGTN